MYLRILIILITCFMDSVCGYYMEKLHINLFWELKVENNTELYLKLYNFGQPQPLLKGLRKI